MPLLVSCMVRCNGDAEHHPNNYCLKNMVFNIIVRYEVGCTLTLCYKPVLSGMITFYIYVGVTWFLDEKNEYLFPEANGKISTFSGVFLQWFRNSFKKHTI